MNLGCRPRGDTSGVLSRLSMSRALPPFVEAEQALAPKEATLAPPDSREAIDFEDAVGAASEGRYTIFLRASLQDPAVITLRERKFFIDNLLVRFIIVMIRWTGLAPWEFEFPFPGNRISTFLVRERTTTHLK